LKRGGPGVSKKELEGRLISPAHRVGGNGKPAEKKADVNQGVYRDLLYGPEREGEVFQGIISLVRRRRGIGGRLPWGQVRAKGRRRRNLRVAKDNLKEEEKLFRTQPMRSGGQRRSRSMIAQSDQNLIKGGAMEVPSS